MSLSLLAIVVAFCVIWIGASVVVSSVEVISKKLNMAQFSVSFLLLGLATSISEFSVAGNAVLLGTPEVSAGNLIGGSMLIALCIIPLLALSNRGIKFKEDMKDNNLLLFMVVTAAPIVVAIDRVIGYSEALILLLLYGYFFLTHNKHKALVSKLSVSRNKGKISREVVKMLIGVICVVLASRVVVIQSVSLAETIGLSTFFVGIVMLAFGTNIPELSIAIRGIITGRRDIALGNYVGSVSLNTPTMAVVTLLHRQDIVLKDTSTWIMVLFLIGLGLFYLFARSRTKLSFQEALILISCYLVYIVLEGSRELFL